MMTDILKHYWQSGKEKMKLPEIDDIITTEEALKLCRYFSLDYLIERIESDPGRYKGNKLISGRPLG